MFLTFANIPRGISYYESFGLSCMSWRSIFHCSALLRNIICTHVHLWGPMGSLLGILHSSNLFAMPIESVKSSAFLWSVMPSLVMLMLFREIISNEWSNDLRICDVSLTTCIPEAVLHVVLRLVLCLIDFKQFDLLVYIDAYNINFRYLYQHHVYFVDHKWAYFVLLISASTSRDPAACCWQRGSGSFHR